MRNDTMSHTFWWPLLYQMKKLSTLQYTKLETRYSRAAGVVEILVVQAVDNSRTDARAFLLVPSLVRWAGCCIGCILAFAAAVLLFVVLFRSVAMVSLDAALAIASQMALQLDGHQTGPFEVSVASIFHLHQLQWINTIHHHLQDISPYRGQEGILQRWDVEEEFRGTNKPIFDENTFSIIHCVPIELIPLLCWQ